MQPMLNFVSPMPPKPNGIADYAFSIVQEVSRSMNVRIVTDDAFARPPLGLSVFDPRQMFRYARPTDVFNYQIGNNPDHAFVLEALRHHPGVVTLHDMNLLYLYETAGSSPALISELMVRSHTAVGRLWSMHQRERLGGDKTRHLVLDLLPEILDRSKAIIVHSGFARDQIRLRHGEEAAAKITVIPHYAPPVERYDRDRCRAALGLDPEELLILSSGFATRAKRFDWIVEALGEVERTGRSFRWVHAGEERPSEVSVTELIERNEELRKRTTITGFLQESELDTYIGAADIVLNLRFPSVGESSGTLARSYAAGNCCIVSDTAAYAGIGCDRVVHVPVLGTVRALVRALVLLIDNPGLRRTIGARAREWAAGELSLERVAARYVDVLSASASLPDPAPRVSPAASEAMETFELTGEPEGDARAVEALLPRFARSGRLRLRYRRDADLHNCFRRAPLKLTLAKYGLTASDIVVRSGDGAAPANSRIVDILIAVGL